MIRIRGAREHNLQNLDLELPLGALVVLCGVSGSGKSSLAFDTLHAEGQRRYLEALALDRAGLLAVPALVDAVDGLPPTIALSQRASAPSRRSTVGSVLDVDPVLRVLFARAGTQHCPECGRPVVPRSHDEIVASILAHPAGTRVTVEAPLREPSAGVIEEVERAGFSRLRIGDDVVRLDELRPSALEGATGVRIVVDRLSVAPDRRDRVADSVRVAAQAGRGVLFVRGLDFEDVFVDRALCWHDDLRLPDLEPALLTPRQPPGACPICTGVGETDDGARCPGCEGTRLSRAARVVRWRGHDLPSLLALPAKQLGALLAQIEGSEVESLTLADVRQRLGRLDALQLSHLPLGRRADRLSGSELQRLRLARQVAGPLSGVLYVLDEPAAGLDPGLVDAVVTLLRDLVDRGNTVLAVEHHAAVVRAADHVVEFGPGAGIAGGQVLYEGGVDGLMTGDTSTGRWLSGRTSLVPREVAHGDDGEARLQGPWREGNAPELVLPRGRVVALNGPSGSGKTTALQRLAEALTDKPLPAGVRLIGAEGLLRIAAVDRGASRSSRSNPATYVGLWDVLRELLAATRQARIRGFTAGTFSLNTKGGRCAACKGTGERRIAMGPLPDLVQPCPVCEGRRFEIDVMQVRWKGLDPSEILDLDAERARVHLAGHPGLDRILRALVRVGLGYVPLGQPTHTLSGGEAMRLSLARELARASHRGASDTAYLLDDPTVGLHPADVAHLLDLLRELADEGATVWLASSDPALVAVADASVALPGPVS